MEHLYPLLISVAIFFLLVLFIQVLKWQGVFNDSHQPVFNRLVTDFALPVTIFSTLAVSTISTGQVLAASIMLGSIIVCGLIAYAGCRLLRLSDGMTGAIIILSSFGSTSTLAYPLIRQTFGMNSEAMALGMIVGEFGACIPFFTLGVLVIAYFGSREMTKTPEIFPVVKNFFTSPIFFSLVAGLIVSQIPPVSALMGTTFFTHFFGYFNNGYELLVAVSVGLMLRPVHIRHILPILGLIVALKLFLQPVLVVVASGMAGLPPLSTEVLLIEAAMPSGAIAAVVADRYGCDGKLASAMVVATYLISLLTIPIVTVLIP
jgi:predicted permease